MPQSPSPSPCDIFDFLLRCMTSFARALCHHVQTLFRRFFFLLSSCQAWYSWHYFHSILIDFFFSWGVHDYMTVSFLKKDAFNEYQWKCLLTTPSIKPPLKWTSSKPLNPHLFSDQQVRLRLYWADSRSESQLCMATKYPWINKWKGNFADDFFSTCY